MHLQTPWVGFFILNTNVWKPCNKITFDLIFLKPVENLIQVAAVSSNAACSMNVLALKILSS
jgi:hypothetical protein